MQANEFTTPQQQAERQRAYEDTLIERYRLGLPLTATDKRDARKIIKARATQTAPAGA